MRCLKTLSFDKSPDQISTNKIRCLQFKIWLKLHMNIQSRCYPVRLRVKILAILPNWICFGRLQTVHFVPTKLSNIKLCLTFPKRKVFSIKGHFHILFCRDDTRVSQGKLFVSFGSVYKACLLLACHIFWFDNF